MATELWVQAALTKRLSAETAIGTGPGHRKLAPCIHWTCDICLTWWRSDDFNVTSCTKNNFIVGNMRNNVPMMSSYNPSAMLALTIFLLIPSAHPGSQVTCLFRHVTFLQHIPEGAEGRKCKKCTNLFIHVSICLYTAGSWCCTNSWSTISLVHWTAAFCRKTD